VNAVVAQQQQAAATQSLLIKPSNFKTVPCRNFHGHLGCSRGDFCHFIHGEGYQGKFHKRLIRLGVEMPRELFQQIRAQNLKNNLITEIRKIRPKEATELENCPLQVVQNFVNAHNAKI
jgi:hypothetical protein